MTRDMTALTEFQTYADAQAQFTPDRLWELFDGNRDALNIAHERLATPAGVAQNTVAETVDTSDAKRRIADMGARLDAVLAPQQQLEF